MARGRRDHVGSRAEDRGRPFRRCVEQRRGDPFRGGDLEHELRSRRRGFVPLLARLGPWWLSVRPPPPPAPWPGVATPLTGREQLGRSRARVALLAPTVSAVCGVLLAASETRVLTPQERSRPRLSVSVSFTTVDRAAPLGDEPAQPVYRLVPCPGEWAGLQALLPERAFAAGVRARSPSEALIVAFAGVRPSSGHHIVVDRIEAGEGEIVISVSRVSPASGDIVEPATTLPYHVVAFPRSGLPSTCSTKVTFRSTDGEILHRQDLAFPKACSPTGGAGGGSK
jgi:hypothetical protein